MVSAITALKGRSETLILISSGAAVFGSLAGLVLIPAAVLIARLRRQSSWWCKVHILLNAIAVLFIILAFGLGMGSVSTGDEGTQFSGEGSDLHHQLGLAIFILVILQASLGLYARVNTKRAQSGKSPIRIAHIGSGVCTVALLYWLIWNGIHTEWVGMSTDGSSAPESVQVIFWVLVAIPLAAYLINAGNTALHMLEGKTIRLEEK